MQRKDVTQSSHRIHGVRKAMAVRTTAILMASAMVVPTVAPMTALAATETSGGETSESTKSDTCDVTLNFEFSDSKLTGFDHAAVKKTVKITDWEKKSDGSGFKDILLSDYYDFDSLDFVYSLASHNFTEGNGQFSGATTEGKMLTPTPQAGEDVVVTLKFEATNLREDRQYLYLNPNVEIYDQKDDTMHTCNWKKPKLLASKTKNFALPEDVPSIGEEWAFCSWSPLRRTTPIMATKNVCNACSDGKNDDWFILPDDSELVELGTDLLTWMRANGHRGHGFATRYIPVGYSKAEHHVIEADSTYKVTDEEDYVHTLYAQYDSVGVQAQIDTVFLIDEEEHVMGSDSVIAGTGSEETSVTLSSKLFSDTDHYRCTFSEYSLEDSVEGVSLKNATNQKTGSLTVNSGILHCDKDRETVVVKALFEATPIANDLVVKTVIQGDQEQTVNSDVQLVSLDSEVALSDYVSKDGMDTDNYIYTFEGYSVTDGSGSLSDRMVESGKLMPGSPLDGAIEVTAVYSARERSGVSAEDVTVKLDTKGGSAATSDVVVKDSAYEVTVGTSSKVGYAFKGWSVDGGLTVAYAPNEKISVDRPGELSLTAVWELQQLSASFEILDGVNWRPGDGWDSSEGNLYEISEAITEEQDRAVLHLPIAAPSRSGYEFEGWLLNEIAYQPGDKIYLDTLQTIPEFSFVAGWHKIAMPGDVVVNVHTNGGSAYTPEVVVKDDVYSITLGSSAKTGFTFMGWATEDNGSVVYSSGDTLTLEEAGELDLYAVWELEDVVVTYATPSATTWDSSVVWSSSDVQGEQKLFVLGDGLVKDDNRAIVQVPEQEPVLAGRTFMGWRCDGQTYAAGSKVYVDMLSKYSSQGLTFTAQWHKDAEEPEPFEVQVRVNGGSEVTPVVTKKADKYEIQVDSPNKSGYAFLGWASTSTGEVQYKPGQTIVVDGTSDVVLHAVYVLTKVPVSYSLPEGTNWYPGEGAVMTEPKDGIFAYEVAQGASEEDGIPVVVLPNGLPERTGYVFTGWSLQGSTTIYQPSAKLYPLSMSGAYDGLKFTANFKKALSESDLKVNVEPSGGSTVLPEVTIDGEQYRVTLENPTKAGYVFAGWSLNDSGRLDFAPNADILFDKGGEVSLTAMYRLKEVSVKYSVSADSTWDTDMTSEKKDNDVVYTHTNALFEHQGRAVVILPSVKPVREGYEFLGWLFGDGFYEPGSMIYADTLDADVLSSLSFSASWKAVDKPVEPPENPNPPVVEPGVPGDLNVNINVNGGSSVKVTISYENGKYVVLIESEPEKPGYDFVGWTADGGAIAAYQSGEPIVMDDLSDTTFTALYEVLDSTVHYVLPKDADWESGLTFEDTDTSGEFSMYQLSGSLFDDNGRAALRLPEAVPTRDGYTFVGWKLGDSLIYHSGESIYVDVLEDVDVTNLVLNTVWQQSDIPVTPPVVTPPGDGNDDNQPKPPVTPDLTVMDISVNTNGGSAVKATATGYEGHWTIATSGIPTKVGYGFAGWSSSDSDKVDWKIGDAITVEDATALQLSAVWTLLEKPVSYSLPTKAVWESDTKWSSSSVSGDATVFALTSGLVDANGRASVILPVRAPSLEGYVFDGWMLGDKTYGSGEMLFLDEFAEGDKVNLSFTAKFTKDGSDGSDTNPDTTTIPVDTKGGSIVNGTVSKTDKGYLITVDGIPVKPGYDFVGWSSDGSDKVTWKSGDEIVVEDVSKVKLTAVWKLKDKTVSYVVDKNAAWESEIEWSSTEDKEGSTQFVLTGGLIETDGRASVALPVRAPVLEGYTFVGWSLGDKVYTSGTVVYLDELPEGDATELSFMSVFEPKGNSGNQTGDGTNQPGDTNHGGSDKDEIKASSDLPEGKYPGKYDGDVQTGNNTFGNLAMALAAVFACLSGAFFAVAKFKKKDSGEEDSTE